MKETKNSKGAFITIGLAIVLIALCTVLLNTMLAHAGEANDNVVHTRHINAELETLSVDTELPDGLNTVIYHNGETLPENGVTAQYAIAVTSEISERVFEKPLAARVFVLLGENYGVGSGLYWNVTAEIEGGSISCSVDAITGVDKTFHYSILDINWEWFDIWNEEQAEQERLIAEQERQEFIARDENALNTQSQATEEEIRTLMELKRQGMLDFAASKEDLPHGARAVEIVNSTGIGDGATAKAGFIMMEGEHNDNATYLVEVALDNGKYLVLTMDRETMELLAYERYDTTLFEYLYG